MVLMFTCIIKLTDGLNPDPTKMLKEPDPIMEEVQRLRAEGMKSTQKTGFKSGWSI